MSEKDDELSVFVAGLEQGSVEAESAGNFLKDALLFTTWFLAVRDQAELDPIRYVQQSMPVAGRLKNVIPVPSQDLFKLTVKIAEAFMEGYVDPDALQTLSEQADLAGVNLANIAKDIFMGKGGYLIESDAIGCPKIVTDSYYPVSLAGMMKKYTNEQGLVASLSPSNRKMLKALVADEVSHLVRLKKPPEPR